MFRLGQLQEQQYMESSDKYSSILFRFRVEQFMFVIGNSTLPSLYMGPPEKY
jgi:hypothetical protein